MKIYLEKFFSNDKTKFDTVVDYTVGDFENVYIKIVLPKAVDSYGDGWWVFAIKYPDATGKEGDFFSFKLAPISKSDDNKEFIFYAVAK